MKALREQTPTTEAARFGPDERSFVYAVARRIVHSAEAAEDVTQEALLLAYRHRDAFRGDSKNRTWLYRIASTTALGYLRRCRRSREDLAPDADSHTWDIADSARSPETLVGDFEVAERARRALDQLAPKYRDVVLMRTELTEHEVAARLGLTVANVKIRAHRAREQLRAAVERESVEPASSMAHPPQRRVA